MEASAPQDNVSEPSTEETAPDRHVTLPATAAVGATTLGATAVGATPLGATAVGATPLGATTAGDVATAPGPEPARGTSTVMPTPPRWWAKYVLWLGTAIIVVIIVAIIRSNSPGSTSGPSLPSSPSASSSATKPLVQVGRTDLIEFTTISKKLDTANIAATKALAGGESQSVAQVATEVAPYLTALDTFNFDLHLMKWPTAMEVPSQDLVLRTQSLASFAGSELSTSAASLGSWFTQFHALAQQTQAADNVVRRDLGLPVTSNYP